MKKIYEINILENKKLIWRLNLGAFILLILFVPLFTFMTNLVLAGQLTSATIELQWILYFPLFYILLLFIHEGIHGFFFKRFSPENPVKYGFKWEAMMAYATSPGSLYHRKQFIVIGLAPFVLISLALTFGLMIGWISAPFYILLASTHAASCVGDFYYAYLLLVKFAKVDIRVEDTETGILIYQA
ncbi:DUF3267 domain-containing protein [Streptococcus minor]|uniref:DUF3267 domain-containing protein n=1 Tax=Streptococcus minor TaxID=229549 RepID=A0A3P1VEE7_9STRE|nr:DUF3267 domain-containing protein [Streptococcus minor]RRD32589.1 DUF3267 domain-containing protein [Streptococcus minor]